MREIPPMLALTTNCLAFYLGALLIERMGICWGVTVFLVTAPAGTIISSIVEKSLQSIFFRLFVPSSNRNTGCAVAVPVTIMGNCPKLGSNSHCAGCSIGF